MLNSCPDTWENSSKKRNEKSYYTENTDSEEEEQSFFTKDFKVSYKKLCQDDNSVEDIVLYTGGNKTEINFLGSKTFREYDIRLWMLSECMWRILAEKLCSQSVRGR